MREKIKILMVLGNTRMGGTQAFILNILRKIDLEKFQIDVAINFSAESGGIDDELKSFGCNIYYWPYFKVINYFQFVKFWREFLSRHHYDIVHGHSTNSASIYLKIARDAGCATIAHCHSTGYRGSYIEQKIKRFFAKRVGPVADYWFACSDSAAIMLFGGSFKDYKRYYEIPNAIDVENYKYNPEIAAQLRKSIGIKESETLFGHIGTFSQPKNHMFLLDVFAEILKTKPNSRLVCCGEGALRDDVEKKALALGIKDRIVFPGVVKNSNEYLMAMDVLIFPSLFEGFGIVVLEAEAAGTQVVLSDVIPKDLDLTDLIHRHSLKDSAVEWAKTACSVQRLNRESYNEIIRSTKYNIQTNIKFISSLYEEMADN